MCNNSVNDNYGLFLVGIGGSFRLTSHWGLKLKDTAYIPWNNYVSGTLMAFTLGGQYSF